MTSSRWPGLRGSCAVIAPVLLAACATVGHSTAVVPPLVEWQGVPSGPAAVAWSPDGATLAVARPQGVVLLDVRSGRSRSVSGPGAIAVDWAPAASLLVVERDAAGGRAVAIDPATGERRVLRSAAALVAARWLHAEMGWLAVASTREVRSYGTEATLTLTVETGRGPAELHRWSAVLPTKDPAADVALGWAAARPNPIDHSLLLPQFRKPPMFPPHVQIVGLDPFDAQPLEIARIELGLWTATVTWSPDGRRAAFSAADGTLRILERDSDVKAPTGAGRGLHPSWRPGGDVLFLGGWLVTPDAAPLRKLLDRAPDALGFWSPAGDRLAVAVGGKLFVFGDLSLPPTDADGERRRGAARAASWELGSLRSQGLLAPEVYRERRGRLREQGTEAP